MKSVKRTRKKKVEPVGPPGEIAGMILRFIITIPSLLLIFYITLLLASRTDGFLSLMEEQLETYTGLDINVEKSWMDLGFGLHLADIGSYGAGPEGKVLPELKIERMDLKWPAWKLFQGGIIGAQKISIEGFEAVLVKSSGQWEPLILEDLAPLPRYYSVGDFTGMLSSHYSAVLAQPPEETLEPDEEEPLSQMLTIQKAKITWIVNNRPSALMEFKSLSRGEVTTDNRRMMHNDLVDGTMLVHNRGGFREVEAEWLETEEGLTFIAEQYIAVKGSGPSVTRATRLIERPKAQPKFRAKPTEVPVPVFTGLPEDEVSAEIRNRMLEAVDSE